MSRTESARDSIASSKTLSSTLKLLRDSDFENGVLLGKQVVLDEGRRPVWKYSRTTFAVQRDGDDQDVCFQNESISASIKE